MLITRKSQLTGVEHTLEMPVTQKELDRCWSQNAKGTEHIQDVLPHLTPEQREFLMTGSTQAEWDEAFGSEDEDE